MLVAFSPRQQGGYGIAVTVNAGYDGYYRREHWLPVRVNMTNSGDDFSGAIHIRAGDGTGFSDITYRTPIDLPGGARKQVFLYVSLDSFARSIFVEIVDGDGKLVVRVQAELHVAQRSDPLFVVVTESPYGAVDLQDISLGTGTPYQARWRIDEIPPLAEALYGVDVILIHDADTGALSAEQAQAVVEWVLSGGHLIVAGGETWQRTTAGLAHLLPVELRGTVSLDSLAALADYMRLPEFPLAELVTVSQSIPKLSARVMAASGDVPLLVRWAYGAGHVDFLAIDPNTEPLRSWGGTEALWYTLIASVGPRPSWSQGFRDWGMAREATLTLFKTVLPGFLQLCGFLAAYIILIGPVNYVVLKRLNRLELAWLTIPGLILVFGMLAYNVGFNLRGNVPTINRMTVMRVWPGYEQAQVASLIGVQSPRRTDYDIAVERGYTLRALPDYGVGLNVPATISQLTRHTAEAILIDAGTIASFVAEGYAPVPRIDATATWHLGDRRTPRITGQITNQSEVFWRDAVVLVKGEARFLGTLAPGASATFDIQLGPQDPAPLSLGNAWQQRSLYASNPWRFSSAVPGWCFTFRGIPLTIADVMRGERFACASTGVTHHEQEIRRRYRLLASLAVDYELSGGRGDRVYVFAWVEEPLVAVELLDKPQRTEDTGLIIVEMPVAVVAETDRVEIPPALTTWIITGTDDPRVQVDITPHAFEVSDTTDAVFQFMPMPLMRLARVDELDIKFRARGSLVVELWNWRSQVWTAIPLSEDSPTTTLTNVTAYVGPENAVNVRVSTQGTTAYNDVDYVQIAYRGRLAR